jgi:hypothetical protein
MSETTAVPVEPAAPVAAPTPEPTPTPAPAPAPAVEPPAKKELTVEQLRKELEDTRKEAANYRTKWQGAKPIVEAHEAAEEANKTEVQKANERAQTLANELAELTLQNVALAHGIPKENYDLLGSGTREELESRAARLAALHGSVAPTEPKAPPSERPVESLRPGASPQPPAVEDNAYPESWRPATRERF